VVRRIGWAAGFDWGVQPFFYTRSLYFAGPMLHRALAISRRQKVVKKGCKDSVCDWCRRLGAESDSVGKSEEGGES